MTGIERGNELNELGWWSNWARLAWLSRSYYYLRSREFEEPLFNHAGVLTPRVRLHPLMEEAERRYGEEGTTPAIFLQDAPGYAAMRGGILDRGYRVTDRFLVMQLLGSIPSAAPEVKCRVVRREDLDVWCKSYLSAFYGELSLVEEVRRSVKKALKEGRTKLILAEVGGRPAGTLAIYRRERYSGVYCVGTIPRFRGRGVATTMLNRAEEIAQENGTKMVLQTFLSDSFERFYNKRGFRRIYSKYVLLKK